MQQVSRWFSLSVLIKLMLGGMASAAPGRAKTALTAEPPMVLAGPVGKFDFMASDAALNRLLAAHKGAQTLELVDLKSGRLLPAIEVGHVQGIAVSRKAHKYFLGNEAEH